MKQSVLVSRWSSGQLSGSWVRILSSSVKFSVRQLSSGRDLISENDLYSHFTNKRGEKKEYCG